MSIAPFANIYFWVVTGIFILLYLPLYKVHSPLWVKNLYMISISLFVIERSINNSFILLPILLFLIILIYTCGKKLLRKKIENSFNFFWPSIALSVLFLCYFKYSEVQSAINNFFSNLLVQKIDIPHGQTFFIGVSYFTFKFIHFIIDCKNGKITSVDLLTFINYTLFFPSFFSGPINRYNSFQESISKQTNIYNNYITGVKRITNGLFKKIVLGDFFFPYSIAALNLKASSPTDILLGAYAYGFYIYFNFAGYTDMAIGCGKMVGIELPENFNYPFLKRNLQKFWSNWHMSLTAWLTDYIYWPLVKKLRHYKILKKKPVTLSNVSIIITFTICGLWHGDGLNFLLWGLYHGIGLAILNGYSFIIKTYAGKEIKGFIRNSPIAYIASTIITFQYVSIGFFLFACDMNKLMLIQNKLF